MNSDLLKVVFVCGDFSGPYFHDIGIPVRYFQAYKLLNCILSKTLDISELTSGDIVFFQRQYAAESVHMARLLKQMKEKGIVTIAHIDDNVWELPKSNPAYSTYQGDVIARFEAVIREAHAATTSTPYLKSLVQKHNPNVYIFRNLVEPIIENFKSSGRDNPDEIRIGWTGTPHHHDDILIVEQALKEICRMYKQVKLVFMGYMPPNISGMVTRDRWEFYEFVPVDGFYACFANLDFDIGIAPLENNRFNWGKTHRKFSEYGILKIPSVMSPIGPYLGLGDLGLTLMPKKNRHIGWIQALRQGIEEKEKTKEMAEKAHQWVMDNQDINKFIFERAQTFYDIHAQVTGTERRVVWDHDVREAESIQALKGKFWSDMERSDL